MKKIIYIFLAIIFILPAYSFEDALIITNGKLNNIKIQHNDIVDVFPLITVMNDKNTLIVHPLKEGETKFSVTKNDRDRITFSVKVTEYFTTVETDKDGFEILNIDCPPNSYIYSFDLDAPPAVGDVDQYVKNLIEPSFLNEDNVDSWNK